MAWSKILYFVLGWAQFKILTSFLGQTEILILTACPAGPTLLRYGYENSGPSRSNVGPAQYAVRIKISVQPKKEVKILNRAHSKTKYKIFDQAT